MAVRPFDPVQEILSSGQVLFGAPLLAAPMIVAILIPVLIFLLFGGFALFGVLTSHAAFSNPSMISLPPPLIAGIVLAVLAGLALSLLSTGAVYGASADALAGRPVDFGSLMASGLKHAGNIFGFYLIVGGVGLLAELVVVLLAMISHGFLGIFGFFALVAAAGYCAFLLMYGIPAIVVGGKSPGDAMLESADLARDNVGPTLILLLAGIVVSIGAAVVNMTFGLIPILGQLIALAAQGICAAFIALFTVRFYNVLSSHADHMTTVDAAGATPPLDTP